LCVPPLSSHTVWLATGCDVSDAEMQPPPVDDAASLPASPLCDDDEQSQKRFACEAMQPSNLLEERLEALELTPQRAAVAEEAGGGADKENRAVAEEATTPVDSRCGSLPHTRRSR
jgi:hypothetical protein